MRDVHWVNSCEILNCNQESGKQRASYKQQVITRLHKIIKKILKCREAIHGIIA